MTKDETARCKAGRVGLRKSKIALLASISSIHTTRWANALSERDYDVHLITQHSGGDKLSASVEVHYLPFQGNK